MSDSLNLIGDNKKLNARYTDLIYPKPIDKRSGDEIALDVISNLGLKVE